MFSANYMPAPNFPLVELPYVFDNTILIPGRNIKMARLNKANVGWNGLLRKVAQVIQEDWIPGKLATELKFRDSLESFLRESAPKSHLEVEYRHLGTTTDIYLKWDGIISSDEVFIELKYNLRQKTEYDRLVGQIEQINPKKHKTIVVLCGEEHNTNLVGRLRERYKKTGSWHDPELRIIVKNAEEDAARVMRRKREEAVRRRQQAQSAAALNDWLNEQAKKAEESKKKSMSSTT